MVEAAADDRARRLRAGDEGRSREAHGEHAGGEPATTASQIHAHGADPSGRGARRLQRRRTSRTSSSRSAQAIENGAPLYNHRRRTRGLRGVLPDLRGHRARSTRRTRACKGVRTRVRRRPAARELDGVVQGEGVGDARHVRRPDRRRASAGRSTNADVASRSSAQATVILYLFDIDGTLLHAHGSGRGAFDAVMAEHHGVADASAGIRYGGKTDPAIVDEIFAARLGRAPTDRRARRVPRRVRAAAARAARGERRERARRRRRGARLSCAAARAARRRDRQHPRRCRRQARRGRARRSVRRSAATAATRRCAPSSSRARSSARGRDVDEVIVVGDTIHDIAAARACGATVCAVATGTDAAHELAHADVVFASLTELPAWHEARFGR